MMPQLSEKPPMDPQIQAEPPGDDGGLMRLYHGSTGFLAQAGKEWFNSLINQPTDPPFRYDARFDNEFVRALHLVVAVIVLTALVIGGAGLITNKTAALSIAAWAMWVLIGTFLLSLIYGIFAFVCGVRLSEGERKRISKVQIFFSLVYTFVPWIPVYAALRTAMLSESSFLLLIVILLLYLCFLYMILNLTKAIRRITNCSALRVWLSVLALIILPLIYILFRSSG